MYLKKILFILIIFNLIGCTEKISYSGLILDDNLSILNFETKNQLLESLGNPNYVDPIESNFYYFSEKIYSKNSLSNEIVDRKILVYSFNEDNLIISSKIINLENEKDITISKDKTKNNLIKQGLIEKIFGGIGNQQRLPTASEF